MTACRVWFRRARTIGAIAFLFLLAPTAARSQDASKEDIAKAFSNAIAKGEIDCSLDKIGAVPGIFSLKPDTLDELFAVPEGVKVEKNPYFSWMTKSRHRAYFMRQPFGNLSVDLTIFGGEVPVEDATLDFVDGKLNGVSVSLFNRGDSGDIDPSEFKRRFTLAGKKMSEQLGVRPRQRKANPTQGLLSEGWTWISEKGMAILEHNPEANMGRPEFLRLKIAPRDAKGAFAAAFQDRAAVRVSDLPKNVIRKGSEVLVGDIPMVDQGPKGYCVVATAQRLFEYYGIPADQHQLAQVANADADSGTNPIVMAEALGKIDYRFKTRFKIIGMRTNYGFNEIDERNMTVGDRVDYKGFLKAIRDNIDDGVPLLWGLVLGMVPEEPPIALQAGGGHMRMIIGYDDKEEKVVFSDSWGAGHEKKFMTYDNAFEATLGLFVITPTVK